VPAATTFLQVLGVTLTLSTQLPQVLRTVVRGSTAGLSPVGIRAGLTANTLWLSYGFAAHDLAQVVCNIVTTSFGTATLLAHRRGSDVRVPRRLDAVALAIVATWVCIALLGRGNVLASTGAAYGLVIGLPQILTLLRTTKAAGVARGSYLLGACGGATWCTYWLLDGRPLVAGSAAYSGLVALTGFGILVLGPRLRARAASSKRNLGLVA
jgi:uncharacterized protein with PQ loop repeat